MKFTENQPLNNHKMLLNLLTFLVCLLTLPSCGNQGRSEGMALKDKNGLVVGVKDGDTIEMIIDGKGTTIRLKDIDCPEKKQPYGQAAKAYASKLAYGKYATLTDNKKKDRNGRIIATVHIGSLNLNEEMVIAGLAWHFKKYSKSMDIARLEVGARRAKRGLWAEQSPIAPWDYRKSRRKIKVF